MHRPGLARAGVVSVDDATTTTTTTMTATATATRGRTRRHTSEDEYSNASDETAGATRGKARETSSDERGAARGRRHGTMSQRSTRARDGGKKTKLTTSARVNTRKAMTKRQKMEHVPSATMLNGDGGGGGGARGRGNGSSGASSGSDDGTRYADGRVEIDARTRKTRPAMPVPSVVEAHAQVQAAAAVSLREAIDSGREIDDVFACRVKRSKSAEFLVHWKGKSHAHNAWIREDELKQTAPDIVERFVAANGRRNVSLMREAWMRPQRVVNVTGVPPNMQVYIKWWELPYKYCTWEKCDAHPEFSMLLERYSQFDNELLDLPYEALNEPLEKEASTRRNCIVGSISRWLIATWLENEGVCVVDNSVDSRQPEIAAHFIAARKRGYKVKAPSLIIVDDANFDKWSREFGRVAPDVNLVEYRGSSECRIAVQRHEWSFSGTVVESGTDEPFKGLREPRFNVLLTTHSTAMLDVVLLRQVHWESIILHDSSEMFASETSSLMSRLSTVMASHRVLMFRSANITDLHVTMNILDFVKRSPLSMRNLEARLLNLSPEQACMQTAALLAALTMDCQYCEVALNHKHKLHGPELCMGSLHTARLIELAEIVLLRRAEQTQTQTPGSIFPPTFDYKSATYIGFLHSLHALQSMYGPLDMTTVPPPPVVFAPPV